MAAIVSRMRGAQLVHLAATRGIDWLCVGGGQHPVPCLARVATADCFGVLGFVAKRACEIPSDVHSALRMKSPGLRGAAPEGTVAR